MTSYAEALQHYQGGQLQEAEAHCRTLLERDADDAQALNLLGVIAHQTGRTEEAAAWLSKAADLDSANAEYHYNLGVALQVLGRLDEAITSYGHVLRLQPGRAEAHNNLGHALLSRNRLDAAQACFAEALRLRPDYAEALSNRGEALRRQGRPDEAVACLHEAVSKRPNFADAYLALGRALADQGDVDEAEAMLAKVLELSPGCAEAHNLMGLQFLRQGQLEAAEDRFRLAVEHNAADAEGHNNLGVVLREKKRPDEARACFYRALALAPEFAGAHNNLGRICEDRGRLEEAAARYRLALCYEPRNAAFHNNLGNALIALSRPEEALRCYQEAVRLQPAEPVYFSNLANALTLTGRPEEAEVCCRQSLILRPDFADGRHNLAITLAAQGKFDEALVDNEEALRLAPEHPGARNCRALWRLQKGDFARGWPEYEWRWRIPGVQRRDFDKPAWDGTLLDGRTILLYAEQALGDTIQFIRYAPLVKARGGTVIVECPPSLVRLVGSCAGIDQVVPRGTALPPFDVQAALLSVPGLVGTTLETVPACVPYLSADPPLVARWREELQGPALFKIGIAWQGSATFAGDRMRSVPLRHFAELARIPGVRLFSLQKGAARDQVRALARTFTVTDLGSTLDEGGAAFTDTAAVMMNLDLVISTDTSIAHLAGALGVPVWVVLAIGPDWRWLRAGETCPWYPTMRLFRQTRAHDWDEVFERAAAALRQELVKRSPARADVSAASPAPSRPARATVCILTFGDHPQFFRRCLDSVLRHTPLGRIELRLGFNEAPASLEYARQVLQAEAGAAQSHVIGGGVRRFCYVSRDHLQVRLWDSPINLYKEPMARLMLHDVPIDTDYLVWLDDDSFVEEGWWQCLCPLFDRSVDYIGQAWWFDFLPGQEEMIRAQPWFRGVPFEHRHGRPGAWFMTGGFFAIRAERLREANFPDTLREWKGATLKQYGGDTLLGEIAHQLGWARAAFDTHVRINVDLEGKYPAPRRGGDSRQFGADR
jgi:tetratricopeptide (TPR) repeat protein